MNYVYLCVKKLYQHIFTDEVTSQFEIKDEMFTDTEKLFKKFFLIFINNAFRVRSIIGHFFIFSG